MVDFKLFGVKFSVSIGFLCLITFMLYVDKTGYMLPTLEAVLLHEAGHIFALMGLKEPPEKVVLRVGSIALCGRYNLSYKNTAVMLISGPLINFAAAFLYLLLYKFLEKEMFLIKGLIMLLVGGFNLLPVSGLDGGELAAFFLSKFLKSSTATRVQKGVSLVFCLFALLLGIFVFLRSKKNPSLILFAIYLLICSFKNGE